MSFKNLVKASFCALSLLASCMASSAEVTQVYKSGELWLNVKGEIIEGDFDEIYQKSFAVSTIELDSPGGNVGEAMRIGRFLRDHYFRTIVAPSASCNSACFLVWAAGVERFVFSPIGVHRPYFEPKYYSSLSAQEAQKAYQAMMVKVEPYLVTMGVRQDVINEMMMTRSTDVHFLDQDQLYARVGKYDVAFNEWTIAQCGDLSDEEWSDYFNVSGAESLDKWQADLESAKDPMEIAGLEDSIVKGRQGREVSASFSAGYKKYLLTTGAEIESCVSKKRSEANMSAVKALQKEITACVKKDFPDDHDGRWLNMSSDGYVECRRRLGEKF